MWHSQLHGRQPSLYSLFADVRLGRVVHRTTHIATSYNKISCKLLPARGSTGCGTPKHQKETLSANDVVKGAFGALCAGAADDHHCSSNFAASYWAGTAD